MVKMFYDSDCNLSLLDGKTVAPFWASARRATRMP